MAKRTGATRNRVIHIEEIPVEVVRKSVKHIRLTVRPPDGSVRISVPRRVGDDMVRQVVQPKIDWIRAKQQVVVQRARTSEPDMVDGAWHSVFGRACRLSVVEAAGKPGVVLDDSDRLLVQVRPGTTPEGRRKVLDRWYRESLAERIPPLIEAWEPVVGRKVAEWRIKKMKTRWGSCNPRAARIWLGLELAKKSEACLEYVVVHEMAHLLEASHNRRFYRIMDRLLPDWRVRRDELNRMTGSAGPA